MRLLAMLGCSAVAGLGFSAVEASAGSGASISLAKPLPSIVRVDQLLIVSGRVAGTVPGTRVVLEAKRTTRWTILARVTPGKGGAFRLRWRVRKSSIGPIQLRAAAIHRGRLEAATRAAQSIVGPAPVYCAPPVPPAVNIPVGYGWIVGGEYLEGGAFPGIDECEARPYSVTATDRAGTVAASQNVQGGHSYTLVVAAGSYTLRATPCGSGSAIVTAGKQTEADAVCALP